MTTRKPKPDALARLLEWCDAMADWGALGGEAPMHERRRTRRLVRALLMERANDAAWAVSRCGAAGDVECAAYTAVLRRPGRAK